MAENKKYPHKMWLFAVSMQYQSNYWHPFNQWNDVEYHKIELNYKKSPKRMIIENPHSTKSEHARKILWRLSEGDDLEFSGMDIMDSKTMIFNPESYESGKQDLIVYYIYASSPGFEDQARLSLGNDLSSFAEGLREDVKYKLNGIEQMAKSLDEAHEMFSKGADGKITIQTMSSKAHLYTLSRRYHNSEAPHWRYSLAHKEINYHKDRYGCWKSGGTIIDNYHVYDRDIGKPHSSMEGDFSLILMEEDEVGAMTALTKRAQEHMEWLTKYRVIPLESFLNKAID